ncbi:MAG: tRNA (uridine(34)/cytosine(34)/5-carboxymethylaminomethyluridine(34)-2'-O)-methyltransferase TrmL [Hyphomonadaceae bacterium]|nr:tRNA (uridine(34)/cytosine(34)/5-carboxymethylaminomethyluridine(34)-2'-O)-methyltransferase TrmL [Clostridia bacterium]
MNLNIVLVEPEIPQNTGNISRTCAATGIKLHLVRPLGFEIDDKKLKRAGLDYWHLLDITYYDCIEDLFAKHPEGQFYFATTKAPYRHSDVTYPDNTFLVFGKETKGLPEELLAGRKAQCIRIPMMEGARSLNLSNSVAVVAYEVLRQNDYESLQAKGQLTHCTWAEEGVERDG